jgi:hypothetical protein
VWGWLVVTCGTEGGDEVGAWGRLVAIVNGYVSLRKSLQELSDLVYMTNNEAAVFSVCKCRASGNHAGRDVVVAELERCQHLANHKRPVNTSLSFTHAHALPTLPCSLLTLILRVPKTIYIVKRSPQYLYDSSWPLPSNRICTPLTVASGIKRPISSPPGSEAYLSSRGFRYSTVGNFNVLMIDNLVSKIYLYFCANEWYEPGSVVIDFQVRH